MRNPPDLWFPGPGVLTGGLVLDVRGQVLGPLLGCQVAGDRGADLVGKGSGSGSG